MSTQTRDTDDRYPTAGPDTEDYERYRHVTTDGETIVYDSEDDDAWVQASHAVSLEQWR